MDSAETGRIHGRERAGDGCSDTMVIWFGPAGKGYDEDEVCYDEDDIVKRPGEVVG